MDDFQGEVEGWLREYKTNQEIADLLEAEFDYPTTETSVRRLIKRFPILGALAEIRRVTNEVKAMADPYQVKYITEDEVEVTLPPEDATDYTEFKEGDIGRNKPTRLLTVEDVMARHKLNAEEWEAFDVLPNQWEGQVKGGFKITYNQFKFRLKRKVPVSVVFPAYVGPKIAAPKKPTHDKPELGVIITDHQAPHVNEELHELILRWINFNTPVFGVIGGDLQDHGYIGRHRDDPAWDTTAQECIDSAFDIIWDYRNADEDTEWSLIKGNHDDRIRNEQLERNERLYGIRAAQWPGDEPEEYVYSLNHLLHLKDLNVNYVEPKGTYEFEQIPITDILAVRHGHKVVKGGAMKTANELGHSVILGHTHRQSVTRQTIWNSITGRWNVVTAIEAGCACKIEGGLGFANAGCPDWQPGFATVTRFPDGNFSFDLATFEQAGILRWRDQVYKI